MDYRWDLDGKKALQSLQSYLGLDLILDQNHQPFAAPLEDVTFVSIDIESNLGSGPGPGTIFELGVAILDTRMFSSTLTAPEDAISTTSFCTQSWREFRKVAQKFRFSESLPVHRLKIAEVLENLLSEGDRKFFLVGHGIDMEVNIMRIFGINLKGNPSLLGILDTGRIAREVIGLSSSLESLLRLLNCPYEDEDLHNAGNDAHYTLRVLLMLAVRGQGMLRSSAQQSRLSRMQEIALSSIPDPALRNAMLHTGRRTSVDQLGDTDEESLSLDTIFEVSDSGNSSVASPPSPSLATSNAEAANNEGPVRDSRERATASDDACNSPPSLSYSPSTPRSTLSSGRSEEMSTEDTTPSRLLPSYEGFPKRNLTGHDLNLKFSPYKIGAEGHLIPIKSPPKALSETPS